MKYLIILAFFNLSFAFAKTVTCTHLEVCKLMNKSSLADLKTTVIINGDPHEFEPSTKEIKELLDAEILIVGPIDLNPWIKNVLKTRKSLNKQTFILTIPTSLVHAYQNGAMEALSHFWLYPKIKCELQNQINENKFLKELQVTSHSKCDAENIESEIRKILAQKSSKIVLAHDALAPFLRTYAQNMSFVTLKGSGHHEEISAASIKALYNLKSKSNLTWVIEKNINIPSNLKSKIDSKDNILDIDTSKSDDQPKDLPLIFKDFGTIYKFISSLK